MGRGLVQSGGLFYKAGTATDERGSLKRATLPLSSLFLFFIYKKSIWSRPRVVNSWASEASR